ncbi:MAG: type II toxin-antitoxin system HicA family toxin [Gammaproteobacteria bacterium]
MTKREKLFAAIRNNPRAVRFEDACRAAEGLGFIHKGGGGSHMVFARSGEPMVLNFQSKNGYIYPYQARQLIEMMNKYGC